MAIRLPRNAVAGERFITLHPWVEEHAPSPSCWSRVAPACGNSGRRSKPSTRPRQRRRDDVHGQPRPGLTWQESGRSTAYAVGSGLDKPAAPPGELEVFIVQ